ncbi:hypothetical protein R3W88_013986 [Solanum pinnatisectum]|uniref:Uncharacterized protein n=1 Tax=Solanum pinnatisectum TaxID=50273 RepID=A0AAV9KRQ8_9SOLN|nr:hypothetical protein R3W88_013986 [Solanum pinnatisectum]
MVIHRKASYNVSPGLRSNSSNDLICSNSFDAFLKDTEKDGNVMAPTLHISNPDVNKIIQECEAAMALKSNLTIKPPYLQALEFVPKSVIAKKNEVEALASRVNPTNAYAIDLGDDSFGEDEEDNILDECFDKVARDGDISLRHQRSGSNKSKRKTHRRQHSWDGKVTGEFVPRQLPMQLAKQNHMTVSIDLTRSNQPKKN